jgi:glucuronoarabinoxylan endo-1,4-beta-xylanase
VTNGDDLWESEEVERKPSSSTLVESYPNPFNSTTTIRYSLSEPADVTLRIFNMLGEEVATLVSTRMESGSHTVRWDATGQPSGMYFFRLQAGELTETRKLVILK